jgi:malonyl-CoA decarboxylase
MPSPLDRFLRLRRRRGDGLPSGPDLGDEGLGRLRDAVAKVLAEPDRAEQRESAARILASYRLLGRDGRARFLRMLAESFGADRDAVDAAVDRLRAAGPGDRPAAERALRRAVTPAHVRFLRLVTGLPGGVKLLVDLRADLLAVRGDDPYLGQLDDELAAHLANLFDVGLLELRRITWEHTSAAVLESLMRYEAVHEIHGWDDLRHRLDSDRRCFAYFHPAMPDEPLVFVEIALTEGLADKLQPLLDQNATTLAPDDADTAIFYSISNCQPGLAGVNLGNELIKHVVEELRRDVPGLRTFATLSPIPGFLAWAEAQLAAGELTPEEREVVGDGFEPGDPAWVERARPGILSLCARYLTRPTNGRAADPVANFHLANGASVARINWLANPAPYGMKASLGLMVNYRYEPDRIAANTKEYLDGGLIPASREVRALVR